MNDLRARRLRIHGRVQGVWFRESMRQEAERLGIAGWVRNCRDGTVEAIVQGTAPAVEAITQWARRGPDQASVTRLEEIEEPVSNYAGFEKRPTA